MKFFSTGFYVSFLAVCMLLNTSCESDNEGYISLSDELTIRAVKNGESVDLAWTLTDLPNFTSYAVYYSTNKDSYQHGGYSSDIIYSSDDFYKHKFTHSSPKVLGVNYYWVEAVIGDEYNYGYGQRIRSNLDSVNISGYTVFNGFPRGIEFYPNDDLLCFVDGTNTCTVYDYTKNEVLSEIPVGYNFSYPCITKYNGVTEFYVCDQDYSNNIKVYSTDNYSLIHIININLSGNIYSIASNGSGVLYVSTSYGRLYLIDRATGNILQEHYISDDCYLKYDSQRRILYANENDSYGYIYKFTLNTQGLISNSNSVYTRGYYYPAVKLNSDGVVYTLPIVKYMDNQYSSLFDTPYPQVQDIEFDGSYAYAAPVNTMSVVKYNNAVEQSKFDMPGYPVYLYKDGNKLVTLFVENQVESSNINYNRSTKGYSHDTPFGIKIIDL